MLNKVYIGIDPGAKGCLAMVYEWDDEPVTVEFYDYPNETSETDYFNKLYSKCQELASKVPVIALLEEVHSMPRQSSQSMFSFGINNGKWILFLQLSNMFYDTVSPQRWMKAFGIKREGEESTKDAVKRWLINQAFCPASQLYSSRGAYFDGRADALCIAMYAQWRYGDKVNNIMTTKEIERCKNDMSI